MEHILQKRNICTYCAKCGEDDDERITFREMEVFGIHRKLVSSGQKTALTYNIDFHVKYI